MNKNEINAKYLVKHDALGKQKEAPDKEAFDVAHRKIWSDCKVELTARRDELQANLTPTVEEAEELKVLVGMLL